jgi:hypothetical protein
MSDPFNVVKDELDKTIHNTKSYVEAFTINNDNNLIIESIRTNLKSIDWDVQDLEETIKITSKHPEKFNLTNNDLENRQIFINETKEFVQNTNNMINNSYNNNNNIWYITQYQRLNNQQDYSNKDSADSIQILNDLDLRPILVNDGENDDDDNNIYINVNVLHIMSSLLLAIVLFVAVIFIIY